MLFHRTLRSVASATTLLASLFLLPCAGVAFAAEQAPTTPVIAQLVETSTPQAARESVWRVVRVTGAALVRASAAASWSPATPGAALGSGSAITTGGNGWALVSNGADSMVLSGDSQLEFPRTTRAGGILGVLQRIGSILFDIETRAGRKFEVTTPYLVATVKGTTFRIDVTTRGASVRVSEGVVGVRGTGGGAERDVAKGQTASVGAASKRAPADLSRRSKRSRKDDAIGISRGANPGGVGAGNNSDGDGGDGDGNGNAGGNGDADGNGSARGESGSAGGGNGAGAGRNNRGGDDDGDDGDDDDEGNNNAQSAATAATGDRAGFGFGGRRGDRNGAGGGGGAGHAGGMK